MIIGMNKISYFSTAVFSPILITKPIAKVWKAIPLQKC
jgi:hypothetical protein